MITKEPWISSIQPLDLEGKANILLPWFISEIQGVFHIIYQSIEHKYCYSIQTPL